MLANFTIAPLAEGSLFPPLSVEFFPPLPEQLKVKLYQGHTFMYRIRTLPKPAGIITDYESGSPQLGTVFLPCEYYN